MIEPLPARILLVDDDPRNLLVLESVLAVLDEPLVMARSGEEALKRVLEMDFAVILLDIQMPGMDGFEAAGLIRQRERSSRTPIVFLTALHDQEFIDRGYLAGAVDYMSKPIVPAILRSKVAVFVDLYRKTEEVRRQAMALHELQQRDHERELEDQRRIADLALQRAQHETLAREQAVERHAAAALAHKAEELTRSNEQLQAITLAMTAFLEGRDLAEVWAILLGVAMRLTNSHDGFLAEADHGALHVMGSTPWPDAPLHGLVLAREALICNDTRADPRWQSLAEPPLSLERFVWAPTWAGAEVIGGLVVSRREDRYEAADLWVMQVLAQTAGVLLDSQKRQRREADLQAQLRQAQKMEAIGNLAGGIAHDFNNLLTVIRGYVELMLDEVESSDLRENVEAIRDASDRAAGLTQQLLAFSRKQVMRPRAVDLNAVVDDVTKLLARVLGERVQLQIDLAKGLGMVLADPAQVEQTLMNLAINARDAMPQGGRLRIATSLAHFDASVSQDVSPGDYAVLTVEDEGEGMEEATRLRVFEPFFTTKAMGKGTGLGLATVYGIVKQTGGHIWVESKPGQGAVFRVALPLARSADAVEPKPPERAGEAVELCCETLLLVEDETPVRDLVRRLLEGAGYTVLVAPDGERALQLCESHPGTIDLLLTDVVMPGIDGRELGRRAALSRSSMAILYMSGYMDDTLRDFGVDGAEMPLLQKPFSSRELLRRVRGALQANQNPPTKL
jgi:signal transduction histidine kinase/DNA-binding response OmpR family regulator